DATVRRPARVRDAGRSDGSHLARSRIEIGNAAHRTHPLEGPVHDRDARRVIATVFELAQTLDEDRHDVSLGNRPDDSTHDADCSRGLAPYARARLLRCYGVPAGVFFTGRFQDDTVVCRVRDTVSASAGASRVSVVPAPSVAPRPTRT